MANEVFIELAVVALAARLRGYLPTFLRALETELGLDPNAIEDPQEVVEVDTPPDNRSPLIVVFDTRTDPLEHGAGVERWLVDCTVGVSFVGDADLAAGALKLRRYAAAVRRCVRADPTLGGRVVGALVTDYSATVVRGDQSLIRHVAAFGVAVRVNTL